MVLVRKSQTLHVIEYIYSNSQDRPPQVYPDTPWDCHIDPPGTTPGLIGSPMPVPRVVSGASSIGRWKFLDSLHEVMTSMPSGHVCPQYPSTARGHPCATSKVTSERRSDSPRLRKRTSMYNFKEALFEVRTSRVFQLKKAF